MAGDMLQVLKQVPLFASLKDEVLAGLAPHLRRRAFRRGMIIFHKDQAGDALYVIESGQVDIFLPAEDGEEYVIDSLGPGDVFGEMAILDGGARSASAIAKQDSVTFTLGRGEFQRHLAAAPDLASALIGLLSGRVRHVMRSAESLAFLDIQGRIARLLLELADRYGVKADGEINFDVTQAELARMVGATRERVNRALASFRVQGLIELRPKRVVILNRKGLDGRIY